MSNPWDTVAAVPTPPLNDDWATINRAKARAERERAAWLLALHHGDKTLGNLISAASTDHHLHKLKLVLVVEAVSGCGRDKAQKVLARAMTIAGGKEQPIRLSWLLGSTAAARQAALVDSMETLVRHHSGVPWLGFPYTKRSQHPMPLDDDDEL